jgi:hypothetical protein
MSEKQISTRVRAPKKRAEKPASRVRKAPVRPAVYLVEGPTGQRWSLFEWAVVERLDRMLTKVGSSRSIREVREVLRKAMEGAL